MAYIVIYYQHYPDVQEGYEILNRREIERRIMLKRHAYMIIAYSQWELLKKLMHLLDDDRNDIYIHINKKIKGAPFNELITFPKKSKVYIVERIPIDRGTYSIFDAQMVLLKSALSNKDYTYFHLLSGQDLPLKSQDYIHDFFEKNDGKNFIDVIPPEKVKKDWYERYSLYQFLVPYTLDKNVRAKFAKAVRKIAIIVQKAVGVNRFKKYEKQGFKMCYGSSWFSITKGFAEYLVENEPQIQKMYQKRTFIPEESIPQTFLWSSRFKDTLYDSDWLDNKLNRANMRMIFWTGNTSPETITMKHIDILRNTNNLFARKFDIINHGDAVEAIEAMLQEDKE